ncbi:MAG: MarR family transcriptional regulator [Vicinamibacteria bacterium]|nr:MarR family transcriptional regulator [Vicinamibacteria bacterium]
MKQSGIMRRVRAVRGCCERQESALCRQLGLSTSELGGLLALSLGEECGVGELARRLALSHSRASRVVDGLVQRGLLRRRTAEHDRRAQTLGLTAKGAQARRRLDRAIALCEQKLWRHLGARQIAEIERGLSQLIAALQAD